MTTKQPKRRKSCSFKKILFPRLQDPEMAAGYLTACLEEGPDVFLLGVKDVVEALGGIAKLAKSTELNREGLYDMLSKNGNPRLSSLTRIVSKLGFRMQFVPKLQGTKAA